MPNLFHRSKVIAALWMRALKAWFRTFVTLASAKQTHRSIINARAGNVYITNDTERIGLQTLFDHISSTTFHNAHHRLNEVNCTIVRKWIQKWTPRLKTLSISNLSVIQAQPHSPEQLIVDVFTWLSDLSSQYPIMWIHHQDRSQTSFFAHVIAELLDELAKLSGSFFCTDVDGGIDITHIVPTLASQLAQNIPGTQSIISQTTIQNPFIFTAQAKSQIKRLILNPLFFACQSNNLDTRGIPNVFLIHGLEEFDSGDQSQLSFLYAFSDALTQLATENIPYRLVLVGGDSSNINHCLTNTDLRQKVLERSITVPASLGKEEEGGGEKTETKKREDARWHLMNTLRDHTSTVSAIAFSTDGTRLASASYDRTVRLWDGETGSLFATLEGHFGVVYDVVFSPDGLRLASGSSDKTIRLWNVTSRSLITTLQGHFSLVCSVAFSPDGSRIASGSDDKTVRLWDGKTGLPIAILEGHTDIVRGVSFSADGSMLASGSSDHTIRLWESKGGGLIATLTGHSQPIYAVAFSPHGSRFASASTDNTVRLWEGKTKSLITILYGHSFHVISIAFSPDGSILASGSFDKTVRLWDAKTGSLITTLKGHSAGVQLVTFSPDGSILASGAIDKTLRLWDVKTGGFITSFDNYSPWHHSIAFSPDGLSLAYTSSDYTIQIWQ